MQDARLLAHLGPADPRAVRRRGRQAAPLPLRRPGQLPRSDGGAAGEQRPAHRAGDAGRHTLQGRPRPRRTTPRLERGVGTAPAVGPAVVAADPAGTRARERSAGVPGPLRGLARGRGEGGRAGHREPRRDGQDRGDGRCDGSRRVRLSQVAAGVGARRAARAHRVGRREDRRRQLLRVDGAQPAHRRPRHRDHDDRPGQRGAGGGRPAHLARAPRRTARHGGADRAAQGGHAAPAI